MTFASRGRRALGAALLAAWTLDSGSALAAPPHVAVVDGDAALVHALDVALAPWGVEVSEHAVVGPGATMPMAADRARMLAKDTHADVVVWLSSAGAGETPEPPAFALWVYDADSGHASTRRLPSGPPFDERTAAGIALSVKTILRTTTIAPPPERFGASRSTNASTTAWRFDLDVGGVARTGEPGVLEPRAGLAASLWPGIVGRIVGVSLGLEGGTGIRVEDPRFTATVLDVSLRGAAAARWPVTPLFALEASLGIAAHALFIDGYVTTDRTAVSLRRIDPALEPRIGFDLSAFGGHLHAGPWIGLSYLTLSQSIAIRGEQVFDLAPLVAQAALRLSVELE